MEKSDKWIQFSLVKGSLEKGFAWPFVLEALVVLHGVQTWSQEQIAKNLSAFPFKVSVCHFWAPGFTSKLLKNKNSLILQNIYTGQKASLKYFKYFSGCWAKVLMSRSYLFIQSVSRHISVMCMQRTTQWPVTGSILWQSSIRHK